MYFDVSEVTLAVRFFRSPFQFPFHFTNPSVSSFRYSFRYFPFPPPLYCPFHHPFPASFLPLQKLLFWNNWRHKVTKYICTQTFSSGYLDSPVVGREENRGRKRSTGKRTSNYKTRWAKKKNTDIRKGNATLAQATIWKLTKKHKGITENNIHLPQLSFILLSNIHRTFHNKWNNTKTVSL